MTKGATADRASAGSDACILRHMALGHQCRSLLPEISGAPECICPPDACLGGDCERCFGSKGTPLLPGRYVEPGSVRGYYIDLAFRAQFPRVAPPWLEPGNWHVASCQAGLAAYERFLTGDGDEWLGAAIAVARFLVDHQVRGGHHDGGWEHTQPFAHTFRLSPGWISAMSQGEGASLLVRVHRETGDDIFAEAALRALKPMQRPVCDGGAHALLDGRPFPEEYPTSPPSFVLNGAFFALWGYYDVWQGLGDEGAGAWFREGSDTLAWNIHRWDLGYWSRYDLYPHPVVNIASPRYHRLHINLLRAMQEVAPHREFLESLALFEWEGCSTVRRIHAVIRKAAFRIVVPRNSRFALRLPWAGLAAPAAQGHEL